MFHMSRLGRFCIPHYPCNRFFRTLWVRMALQPFYTVKISLNLEAVNLPHLWLNHSWLFDCYWVFSYTRLIWSSDKSRESVRTWLSIAKSGSGSHEFLKLLAKSFKVRTADSSNCLHFFCLESNSSTKHDLGITVCTSLNKSFIRFLWFCNALHLYLYCHHPKILLSFCSFFSCFFWLLRCFFQISFICKSKFRNFIRHYLFFSTRDFPCCWNTCASWVR